MQFRKTTLPAFFIQTTTIALLMAGFSNAATPQAERSPKTDSPDRTFQLAVDKAMSAANIVQSAQSAEDWKLVSVQWQEAIDLLKSVPPFHPQKPSATKKVVEYQRNLAYANKQKNSRLRQEIQEHFFACVGDKNSNSPSASNSAIATDLTPCLNKMAAMDSTGSIRVQLTLQLANNSASNAMQIAKKAQYPEEWNAVASQWQRAIALLKTVPASHAKKAYATQKVAEYQRNISSITQKINFQKIHLNINECLERSIEDLQQYSKLAIEAVSQQCVKKIAASDSSSNLRFEQAMQLAKDSATKAVKLAKTAKYSDDWSLVSDRWHRAIALLKTVPASHPKGFLAAQKIAEYQRNLMAAKQQKTNLIFKEVRQQASQCFVANVFYSQASSSLAQKAILMECAWNVVMLDAYGRIRPDASDRTIALLKLARVKIPKPMSQGQAALQLKPLQGSKIFTVPVTIGGKSRTFLLDTGASNTIIDTQIAREMRLERNAFSSDRLENVGVGDRCSELQATELKLPALSVQQAKVEVLYGMGIPKTSIIGNLSGVLGIDFLSNFDLLINPQASQLQLLPPTSPIAGAIPLEGNNGLMTTQVYINGEGPFTFLLDTGADVMVVSESVAERLGLDFGNVKETVIQGFCGTSITRQTQLNKVSLQQYQVTKLDAVILGPGILEASHIDGIVGQSFLNRYQQHWRFGQRNELGLPEEGSLSLSPL